MKWTDTLRDIREGRVAGPLWYTPEQIRYARKRVILKRWLIHHGICMPVGTPYSVLRRTVKAIHSLIRRQTNPTGTHHG